MSCRFALLVNDAAGNAGEGVVAEVTAVLGPAAALHRDSSAADVAAGHPGARLVVVGGDGSLHVAVQQLWDAGLAGDVEVALIPAGTGNDFARGAGIPLDVAAAAEVAAHGTARPVDLAIDEAGMTVVNVVHAGLGAEAARAAEPIKPVSGPAAYPLGAALAAVTHAGWAVAVTADGRRIDGYGERALMVVIGNGSSIGGGTPMCPDADPADGLLDVVVVGATGPMERTAFAAALRKGEHLDRADVVRTRARTVEVSGEPMRYDADGEVGEPRARSRWSALPGAWRLVR